MKITEFLKKYSLINNKFIDDFYSFYDEGKNEYDFTINLELVAMWLNVRKDHLKTLLISNFSKGVDYIEQKVQNLKGKGVNNRIDILLTYTCAKLLCMISKSEKASSIRIFYIELEKLIITYKDNIVNDLNKQLGIQETNKKIIKENEGEGLLYILRVEDETYKIGTTSEIKKRMSLYNVGRIDELPIVYVFKCKNIKEVEKCIKKNMEEYRLKKHKNNELFKVDEEFIKDTVVYCNKKTLKIKENKKLLNSKKITNWLIIIDKKNTDTTQLYKPVKKYVRKTNSKKNSKTSIKKSTKTTIKKNSKKK
jgi:phage anti-repressor protein/predicted GIY-YIG superfamily endonuclease